MPSHGGPPAGRLKILYVIVDLDIGGSERQLTELVSRLNRRRFAPAVCCLGRRGPLADVIERAGVPVEVIGLSRFTGGGLRGMLYHTGATVARGARFVRFVFTERPHLVQSVLFWACVAGSAAAWAARVPVILSTRRGLGHFEDGRRIRRWLTRAANRVTDVVVANADAVKAEAVRKEGLHPDKVLVIRNGIDADRFGASPRTDPSGEAARRSAGPTIGVIANFLPYKGHEFFIDAWRRIVQDYPAARALLVGDGPLRATLETRVRADRLTSSIRFLGMRSDIPSILACMDIVAHPSLEEGSSNAVLEAMAASKPVVATAVGGTVEAIVHGENGLLVPARDSQAIANAVCWLIRHPDAARALGAAARHRVEVHYGVGAMVDAYETLYADRWARVGRK